MLSWAVSSKRCCAWVQPHSSRVCRLLSLVWLFLWPRHTPPPEIRLMPEGLSPVRSSTAGLHSLLHTHTHTFQYTHTHSNTHTNMEVIPRLLLLQRAQTKATSGTKLKMLSFCRKVEALILEANSSNALFSTFSCADISSRKLTRHENDPHRQIHHLKRRHFSCMVQFFSLIILNYPLKEKWLSHSFSLQPPWRMRHPDKCGMTRDHTLLTREVCCCHRKYQSWINAGHQIFDIPAARITCSDYWRRMWGVHIQT